MSIFKRIKVVRVPTKEKGVIAIDISSDKMELVHNNCEHEDYQHYHLYFLSNDDIQETHWVLQLETNEVFRVAEVLEPEHLYLDDKGKSHYDNFDPWSCKKIIATTDKSIHQVSLSHIGENWKNIYYPEPPQEFIKEYCEKGGIDEVMVKYEEWNLPDENGKDWGHEKQLQLWIGPNNTISIKPVKDTYTREELEKYLSSFADAHGINWLNPRTKKWIDNNL